MFITSYRTLVYELNLNYTSILMTEDLEHGYIITVEMYLLNQPPLLTESERYDMVLG